MDEHLQQTRQALEAASRLTEQIEQKELLIEQLKREGMLHTYKVFYFHYYLFPGVCVFFENKNESANKTRNQKKPSSVGVLYIGTEEMEKNNIRTYYKTHALVEHLFNHIDFCLFPRYTFPKIIRSIINVCFFLAVKFSQKQRSRNFKTRKKIKRY